jgi:DNA-binding XRE family transcriptional regulator
MDTSPVGECQVSINNVQRFRERLMMSKAELARKAGLSTLTIDRVEAGRPCRLDTKRKILLALGLKVSDKDRVFGLGGPLADEFVSTSPPAHLVVERSENA